MVEQSLELLQKQLIEKNENLNKLALESKEIKSKIKLEKIKLKRNKINGSTTNILIRVSTELDSEILDIKEERGDSISKPTITALLCRHRLWATIKKDLINYRVL